MINSLLKRTDIFGYSPSLQINKKKSFKNPFGGFISLGIIPLICIGMFLSGKEFYSKERPAVIISTKDDPVPLEAAKFNDTGFIMALGVYDSNYSMFYDESYFTVSAGQHIVTRSYENGKHISKEEVFSVNVIKCSQKSDRIFKNELEMIDTDSLLCLQSGDFYLDGYLGRDLWSYFEINFNECKNSTMVVCKSSEEIKKKLAKAYLGIYYSDYGIQAYNFNKPTNLQLENFISIFSILNSHEIWMYFKNLIFESDVGFFLNDFRYLNYFTLDEFRESSVSRELDNQKEKFLSLKLVLGLNTTTYRRLYIKLNIIAANCGGIMKLLLSFGMFFAVHFRKLTFKTFIVNFFFDIKSLSVEEGENLSDINKNHVAAGINKELKNPQTSSSGNKESVGTTEVRSYNNFMVNWKDKKNTNLGLLKSANETKNILPGTTMNTEIRRLSTRKDLKLARLVKGNF
jgi:hypothetical protein